MAGALQALIGSLAGVIKDAYFKYVTLLLPGNGTNGAQNNTFLDASTNNFTITRNGNTTQGTFTPYGANWSNFVGGGNYLSNTSATLVGTSVSTFTAEAWIYMTAAPTSDANNISGAITIDGQAAANLNYLAFGPISSQKLVLRWYDGAAKTCTGSTTLALNTWYHIAVVANSNAIAMYVNGVAETLTGTTTLTNRSGTTSSFALGTNFYGVFTGYLSNVRVGTTAVYTSAFTPSTTPLTAISGTSLLTCQSNRFVDNSTNAFALTVTGTPSVQRFSPFSPSSAYSTSTTGGSGYFDGTGDNLVASFSALNIAASQDFTIECWLYQTSVGVYGIISGTGLGSDYIDVFSGGTQLVSGANILAPTITTITNAWYHLAYVRSSNVLTCYVNGVSVGSASWSGAWGTSGSTWIGSIGASGNYFPGYISNLRIVKGTAVYTANFTPPSAPLTAITNTSLLLLGTNAGVIDNAMMNDLETVGNAQISTTQSKFGGSSIAFDGSGDYLTLPYTPNLRFDGDFTVEFWVRLTSKLTSFPCIINNYSTFTTNGGFAIFAEHNSGTAGKYNVAFNGTFPAINSTTSVSYGSWQHIALVRSGSTVTLYVDGTANGTTTSSASVVGTANNWWIGAAGDGLSTSYINGYIDDLRITKGYARYTANFTPPTAAFPTS